MTSSSLIFASSMPGAGAYLLLVALGAAVVGLGLGGLAVLSQWSRDRAAARHRPRAAYVRRALVVAAVTVAVAVVGVLVFAAIDP